MPGRDMPLDRRYLHHRRSLDEARALRRVRATRADLAVWRRDKAFREAENAAKVAPKRAARAYDPWKVLGLDPNGDIAADFIAERYDTDKLGFIAETTTNKRKGLLPWNR